VYNPQLTIIRKSSFTSTPWKNGGGITHEAIRVPAGGGDFRWRVSVAHIDVPGPFSEFAKYNRTMVLLQGAGVELRFGDGTLQTLRRVGDWVQFDGAVPTHCELVDGACVDLNLMVSKADRVDARVELVLSPLVVSAAEDGTLLVVPIDGGVSLNVEGDAEPLGATLEPWDLAILSHGAVTLRRLDPSRSTDQSVFVANLEFVSGE